ncbi:MAG: hypothetical protein ABJL55_19745 [Roseibium sp.]
MPNQNPVVFVHGLFGFGPDELGPLNYWGRAFKVPSALNRRYEASVGPVGSAHDRACELAAQIKGLSSIMALTILKKQDMPATAATIQTKDSSLNGMPTIRFIWSVTVMAVPPSVACNTF